MHSRCQAYVQAEAELASVILYIESYWLKIEDQVTTLRDIWHALDDRLQMHHNHFLQALQGILESAVHILDDLFGDTVKHHAVGNSNTKQGQFKRLKYAVYGKRSLERITKRLERWHRQFDPSWILLSRLSVPIIQTQLSKKQESRSEAIRPYYNFAKRMKKPDYLLTTSQQILSFLGRITP